MKLRKLVSLLLSTIMMSIVVCSAASAATLETLNPEWNVSVVGYKTLQGAQYVDINFTLTLNGELEPYNEDEETGLVLSSYDVSLDVDKTLFDVTGTVKKTGKPNVSYNPATDKLVATYTSAGTPTNAVGSAADAGFNVRLTPVDSSIDITKYSQKEFMTFVAANFTFDNYTEGTKIQYRLDGKSPNGSQYVPVVKVDFSEVSEPVAPVVESVTIDPAEATVKGGESVTFTATVTGTDGSDETGAVVALDKSVTWEATAGTVVDGVFTAPEATDAEQEIIVKATSVADDTKSAVAKVTVPAKEVVVPDVTVTITDAEKTTNEAWVAAHGATMFWGVTVSGAADSVAFKLTDTATSESQTKNATIAVDGEGDKAFGVYVVVGERINNAMELSVTAGTVTETKTATHADL